MQEKEAQAQKNPATGSSNQESNEELMKELAGVSPEALSKMLSQLYHEEKEFMSKSGELIKENDSIRKALVELKVSIPENLQRPEKQRK